MEAILFYVVVGSFVFFIMLYNIVRSAVEDGTLKALLKYERLKSKQNKSEDNKSSTAPF
jgi:hypothetical protein